MIKCLAHQIHVKEKKKEDGKVYRAKDEERCSCRTHGETLVS